MTTLRWRFDNAATTVQRLFDEHTWQRIHAILLS
jgi:hypothetical protein